MATGWPDGVEYETGIYELEQLIAVGGMTLLAAFAIGVGIGGWRGTGPLDGYWLANPFSIAFGYFCLHTFIVPALGLQRGKYSR
jgi:hypothetical protein